MKICAACHTDLPKESYSKKQWKLDQRWCKVCITNNREVQSIPKQDNNDSNTDGVVKLLDSICLENVEKISDEELFKQPPPDEDCPICFLRLPFLNSGWNYVTCCGKRICRGCIHAPVYDDQGNKVDNEKCAFCRAPTPDIEERIENEKKRVEANDPIAIFNIGYYYSEGLCGFPQDYKKALKLFHRAGELGYADAFCNIGYAYDHCEGVEKDEKKANHYYELAAMKGNADARYNLATSEKNAGNINRALRHYMIAVASGDSISLNKVKDLYSNGEQLKKTTQQHYDHIKNT